MHKKIFSDQSLSELKDTMKKQRSRVMLYACILILSIGVIAYFIAQNGFSFFSLIPLLFLPLVVLSLLNLKKVKDEIKVRERHIALQNKMQESLEK